MSDDVHGLAGAYALNALPREEEAFFERHLAVCAHCSQEVAELTSTAATLGAAAAETPPPGLRERVLAEARETPQEPLASPAAPGAPAPPAAPPQPSLTQRLRPVLATAAAVVAVALLSLGTAVVMLADRAGDLESELADTREVVDVLSQHDMRVVTLESPPGTQARLLHGPEQEQAAVVFDGLEDLPAEKAYQLWVMHGETPRPDRVFRPDDGRAVVSVEHDLTDADAVAVTVEPREGSEQPTGDILIQGALGSAG